MEKIKKNLKFRRFNVGTVGRLIGRHTLPLQYNYHFVCMAPIEGENLP